MKNKKSIQFIFSICLYIVLMSFFGCENESSKKLMTVGSKAVTTTLSFFVK